MSDTSAQTNTAASPALVAALVDAVSITFVPPNALEAPDRAGGSSADDLSDAQRAQATEMIKTALREGLLDEVSPRPGNLVPKKYTDGSTAQAVIEIGLQLRFVAKWDDNEKVLREAGWLRSVAQRADLPQRIRDRVPRVFAVRRGEETHAYLMEHFPSPPYRNLARALKEEKGDPAACRDMISAALDALFDTYAATVSGEDHPLLPDIGGIYVGRIQERLTAKGAPEELLRLVNSPLMLGAGDDEVLIPSCAEMLREVKSLWPGVTARLTPSFVTMVFGDPHPGNIMLHIDHTGLKDIRIIDPKEWGEGDYLFDVAKFLHYLQVTWLVEDLPAPHVEVSQEGGRHRLEYRLEKPSWLSHGREGAERRIKGLLASLKARNPGKTRDPDPHWSVRLHLGMASNLLGVAGSRYRDPKKGLDSRRVILAEGLRALHQFLGAVRKLAAAEDPNDHQ